MVGRKPWQFSWRSGAACQSHKPSVPEKDMKTTLKESKKQICAIDCAIQGRQISAKAEQDAEYTVLDLLQNVVAEQPS